MMMTFRHILALLAVACLVQCGKKSSKSSQVGVEVAPKKPVVINADLTVFPGTTWERKYSAPWFNFGFTVNNTSDETITIQSLVMSVTSVSATGGIVNQEIKIDPATNVPPATYIMEVPAGTSATSPATVYVDGLDKNSISFSYNVSMDIQGWFGAATMPTARLVKQVYFSTQ